MPSPFEHVDAAAFIGSWPLVPYFSNSNPAVLPGTLLDKATILSARRESNLGFNVVGRSFNIWIDAVIANPITVTFSGTNPLTLDDVIAQINAGVNAGYGQTVAYRDNGFLRLRSAILGESSYLKIDTDPASSPADVFFELGLFAGLESRGGQVVTAPTVDPDRQASLPGQYSVAFGEDLGYLAINRSLFQLAINTDQAYGYWRRGVAKTTSKDVAVSADGFTLTGEDVFCGDITSGQPQDDTILVLDQSGNEAVVERGVDLDTSLALDFWFDPAEQKQYVEATAATPFVAGDDTGDFYVVVTPGGAFGTLEQLKILEVVSPTLVVVMNVDVDGNEIEVGTVSAKESIANGIRRRIDTDRLHVTDFLDAPAGSSVINQSIAQLAHTIDRVERNNRIFCDAATYITDGVRIGDQVVITLHDVDVPYSNNGTYRVLKIIDEKTLELMTNEHGPVVLNPINVVTYGTATVQTDSNFYYEPYVQLSFNPPAGTYRVVFKARTDMQSMVAAVDSFALAPSSYAKEAAFDIQRVVKAIIGPSVTSFDEYLYDDKRNSLENLDFRLNQEHDEVGRHTSVRADDIRFQDAGNSVYSLIGGDSTELGFETGGARRVTITDIGWVGIGVDPPEKLLHARVSDAGGTPLGNTPLLIERDGHCNLQIMANAANTGSVSFTNGGDTNAGKIVYDHGATPSVMGFVTDDVEYMTLNSVGLTVAGEIDTTGLYRIDSANVLNLVGGSLLIGQGAGVSGNVQVYSGGGSLGLELKDSGNLELGPDTDVTATLGRAVIGARPTASDWAAFGHVDYAGVAAEYAFLQTADGRTFMNTVTGASLNFRTNNNQMGTWSTAGLVVGALGAAQADLHVYGGNATHIWLQDTSAGNDAFTNDISGLQLSTAGMNTTSKYTPAVKFMSTDADLTTENPKLLALIVGRATQGYTLDTTGGMAIDFAVTDNTPGESSVPEVAMTIDHSGYVGIGETDPILPLHVVSDGSYPVRLEWDASNFVSIGPANSNYCHFQIHSGLTNGFFFSDRITIQSGILASYTGDNLIFQAPFGTDRVTITNGDGFVGINVTAPSAPLHVRMDSTQAPALMLESFQGGALGGVYLDFMVIEGSGTTNYLEDDDELGVLRFRASDGIVGTYFTSAIIKSEVDGAHSVGSHPGDLSFWTTPTGSTTPVERMRIAADGSLSFGGGGSNVFPSMTVEDASDAYIEFSDTGTGSRYWWSNSGDDMILWWNDGSGVSRTRQKIVATNGQVNISESALIVNDSTHASAFLVFVGGDLSISGNITGVGSVTYTGTLSQLDVATSLTANIRSDSLNFGNTKFGQVLLNAGATLLVNGDTIWNEVQINGIVGAGTSAVAGYELATEDLKATTIDVGATPEVQISASGLDLSTGAALNITGTGRIKADAGNIETTSGNIIADGSSASSINKLTCDTLTVTTTANLPGSSSSSLTLEATGADTNPPPYLEFFDNRTILPPPGADDKYSYILHEAGPGGGKGPRMAFQIGSGGAGSSNEFLYCDSDTNEGVFIGLDMEVVNMTSSVWWSDSTEMRLAVGGPTRDYISDSAVYIQASNNFEPALHTVSTLSRNSTPTTPGTDVYTETLLNVQDPVPYLFGGGTLPFSFYNYAVCGVTYVYGFGVLGWDQSDSTTQTGGVWGYTTGYRLQNAHVYGVRGEANNTFQFATGTNYGVYASASGQGINYSVYSALGIKSWANPHPTRPDKEIVYATLEGGENGTYWRGRGMLEGGKARVDFPEHFQCASSDEGRVDVVVTPMSIKSLGLAVLECDHTGFTVEELKAGVGSYEFSYIVMGLRRGYEEHEPVVDVADYVPGLKNQIVAENTQEWFDNQSPGIKKIFMSSGVLLPDGKINKATFEKMGWPILKN